MVGLVDSSPQLRGLTTSLTENLVSRYYRVENFGFLRLSTTEQFEQTWYPTPNDIVPAGWLGLDLHIGDSGDFNGDGFRDLILQPSLQPHVKPHQTEVSPIILIQNKSGSFDSPQSIIDQSHFPKKHFLYRVGVTDFNSDGKDDVALSAMGSINRTSTGTNSTYEAPLVVFGSSDSAYGWKDSFGNFSVRNDSVQSWVFGYSFGHSMAVGDFDGDKHPDWFSNWYAFYGKKDANFDAKLIVPNALAENKQAPYSSEWIWPMVNAAVSADFNEDGFDDLIYSSYADTQPNFDGGDLVMLKGSGAGLLDGSKAISIPRSNDIPGNIGTNFMVSMDVNGDGHADLIFVEHFLTTDSGDSTNYYSKAKLRAFFGDGKGNLTEHREAIVDPYAGQRHGEGYINVVDMNGDGWMDLVLSGFQINLKNVWASGGSEFDYSTIFLNDKGTLRYVNPSDLAYVQPYQFSGDEQNKPWLERGVSYLMPVDIGSDGMVDFVGLVNSPMHQWPQVEQVYTYAYISKATAPLGRNQANESLIGTKGNDKIYGFDGSDQIRGDAGNDTIDGGSGVDIAVYAGQRVNFEIAKIATGISVKDNTGAQGHDSIVNVERLQFVDKRVAIDMEGNAGKTAKLLGVSFGKASVTNKEYVGIGLNLLDSGWSYEQLMALALEAAGAKTNAAVVKQLWTNLFGSAPTAEQAAPYVAGLDQGVYSKGALGVSAAELALNKTNIDLVGLTQTGIEYL
jgi:hypothetical protein